MSAVLKTSSRLVGPGSRFVSSAPGKAEIVTDYILPDGDNPEYMPLELFLIAFATCVGGTVAPLLKKMGKTVGGLQVDAEGVKRTEHPRSFEKITLTFSLVSPDVVDADLVKAVQIAERGYCPVWAMIKGNVAVETRCEVRKPE
jgi:putative redox protein